jgi:hypothetical protein
MRFAVLAIAAACLCRAENACPWLNNATAAGFLGGAVTASVKPGLCEFRSDKAMLRIEVEKKPTVLPAKCAPLAAIGNEAVVCGAGAVETVIGRVRDQRFAVSITASEPATRGKTRKVAEQVAGSLF